MTRKWLCLAAAGLLVLTAVTADAAAADGNRTLTFENRCGETIWIGATGGNVGQTCSAGESCPAGTECGALTGTCDGGKRHSKACTDDASCEGGTCKHKVGHCFWVLPTPSSGSFELADGASSTVALTDSPITINGQQQKWSGHVYARTGCDAHGKSCQTGICPGGDCRVGTGAVGPLTLAEFTLLTDVKDYYDVSAINGVNVPVEMAPAAGTTYAPAPKDAKKHYWCGNPGGATPKTYTSGKAKTNPSLVGCDWTFADTITVGSTAVSGSSMALVAGDGTTCSSDADCTATGEVCGRAMGTGTAIDRKCGAPIGFWTADEVCVFTANAAGSPFDCGSRTGLYGCSGTNAGSCYSAGAGSSCCGCPAWTFGGESLPATETCKNHNPTWESQAEPWAAFVKAACPTAYSFPYDDPTSTFNCQSSGSVNQVDYTITFCPGGKTVQLQGAS